MPNNNYRPSQVKVNEVGRVCGMCYRDEKCKPGFGRETLREAVARNRVTWKHNT
jgi:hypothetical protein